ALAEEALRVGWSTGIIARGRVILDRIGDGAHALIVATFTTPGARAAPPFMPLADTQDRQQPAPVASAQNVLPFRPVTTVTDNASDARLTEQARRRLEQARDRPELTGTFSHEVGIALNSIVGFAETMLDERFGPIGNERYRGYLTDIRTAGDQVTTLLNGLGAAPDAATTARKSELLDLSEVVQRCVAQLQPHAGRAHVLIRTALTANSTICAADAQAVRQLVMELLSSAIKSTGGQVIVSTSIALGADGSAGEVMLRLSESSLESNPPDGTVGRDCGLQRDAAAALGTGSDLGLVRKL